MNRTFVTVAVVAGLLIGAAGPRVHAQLSAPGASGVVMGHLHLTVKDLDAQKKFWGALGGTPVQNGALALIQLPGTFVMLRRVTCHLETSCFDVPRRLSRGQLDDEVDGGRQDDRAEHVRHQGVT